MKIGAVILTGGESRRMGTDKATLKIDGESFLQKIFNQLEGFGEVLLSVRDFEKYKNKKIFSDVNLSCENFSYEKIFDEKFSRVKFIIDKYGGRGPMDGIYSALKECDSDALFVVSNDIPLFQKELADVVCEYLTKDFDAVVPYTKGERLHPTCAVYKKSVAPIFEKQLNDKNYRMTDALSKLRIKYISVEDAGFSENIIFNVNTVEEYEKLKRSETL